LILAGGGTGGHVITALAIAVICNRGTSGMLFIWDEPEGLRPAGGLPPFRLELYHVGSLNQVSLRHSRQDPAGASLLGAHFLPHRAGVFVRICDWKWRLRFRSGYAAAALSRVPTVAFEPKFSWLCNAWGRHLASAAAVPLRNKENIAQKLPRPRRAMPRNSFELPSREPATPPTVLVFGGSQGARAINQAIRSLDDSSDASPNQLLPRTAAD